MNPADRIAYEAARLYEEGVADTIHDALVTAAELLGLQHVPRPGHGRVREHLRAMAMQTLGAEGYAERVREVWTQAEELMTALIEAFPDAEPRLVGRAARGEIDGGVAIFVRVHTAAPIREIADRLVGYGWEEPEFSTADTRFGRFDRLVFRDAEGVSIVTRCLPAMLAKASEDLFKRRSIESLDVEALRRKIAGCV